MGLAFFLPRTKPARGTGHKKDNPCPVGVQKKINKYPAPIAKFRPDLARCTLHSPRDKYWIVIRMN